jgi:hypothetical protein
MPNCAGQWGVNLFCDDQAFSVGAPGRKGLTPEASSFPCNAESPRSAESHLLSGNAFLALLG